MNYCELCGGELALLGILGTLEWFRCTGCGADQCRHIEEVDPQQD